MHNFCHNRPTNAEKFIDPEMHAFVGLHFSLFIQNLHLWVSKSAFVGLFFNLGSFVVIWAVIKAILGSFVVIWTF